MLDHSLGSFDLGLMIEDAAIAGTKEPKTRLSLVPSLPQDLTPRPNPNYRRPNGGKVW